MIWLVTLEHTDDLSRARLNSSANPDQVFGCRTVRSEVLSTAFKRVDSEMLEHHTGHTFSLEFFQGFGACCILQWNLLRVRVQCRVCRFVNQC